MGSISQGTGDENSLPAFDSIFPQFYSHPSSLSMSVDPFTITASTGFMPWHVPSINRPPVFKAAQDLVERVPIVKLDGTPGLLAEYKLGSLIDDGISLPDLSAEIDGLVAEDGHPDISAITAVFRDYSFLASAYLLEPCWEKYSNNPSQGYGLGRATLPKCLAAPLVKAAEILDIPPFMSYAASYALYNYTLVDPSLGPSTYDNLRLIRAFERGLDPKSSEAGFILTHVHMVQETGNLVKGAVSLLNSIAQQSVSGGPTKPATQVEVSVDAFETMLTAMFRIESHMELMWTHSLPKDYNIYRTFIFGITNQSMFPDGVVYETINNDQPLFFRGESGANDAIIPLLDGLLQIPMPANPLTKILHEFRSYRPRPHREFLAWVRDAAGGRAGAAGVRAACTAPNRPDLTALYLRLLDHVRSFRWRHWMFAREYIIKRSAHPTATGGSPIVTWLPNQLFAVMDLMDQVWTGSPLETWGSDSQETSTKPTTTNDIVDVVDANINTVRQIMLNVRAQREKLRKEVDKYCRERGVTG